MINSISSLNSNIKNLQLKEQTSSGKLAVGEIKQSFNLISPNAIYSKANILTNKVTFKGWSPTDKNDEKISQIVDFITAPKTKKIAVIGHYGPDGDAISSMSTMAELIKSATGKKADIFVATAPGPKYDNLGNIKDFKIIDKYSTSKELKEKYGKYDLVIAADTAEAPMFDKSIKAGILDNAKNTIKIDHHPLPCNPTPEQYKNYSYADINLVDDSMSSASQLLMQFVEPLGLDPETMPKSISNAIATGIISDSNALVFAKNKSTFEDTALLFDNVNYEELVDRAKRLSRSDFEEEKDWLNKIEFSPDGKKAYIIIDKAAQASLSPIVKSDILNRIRNIEGVEFVFSINGDSNLDSIARKPIENPSIYKFRTMASLRSTNENLNKIVDKYNQGLPEDEMLYGGGHDKARTVKTDMTINELKDILVNKLH